MKFAYIVKEYIKEYDEDDWFVDDAKIYIGSARNLGFMLEKILHDFHHYSINDLRFNFEMKKKRYNNDYILFLEHKLSAMNDHEVWDDFDDDIRIEIPLVELLLEDEQTLNHFKKDHKQNLAKALKDEIKFTKKMKEKHKDDVKPAYFKEKLIVLNRELKKLSQQ